MNNAHRRGIFIETTDAQRFDVWSKLASERFEEKQLGRGVSKQAARSFQRLLRRMAPREAQNALEKQLNSEEPKLGKDVLFLYTSTFF